MKVIRTFKNTMSLELCRDTKTVTRDGVQFQVYKPYKGKRIQAIKDMGYFYNNQRKEIKKAHKARNAWALSNGNYEKCLYTLKDGILSIWRLNPNDEKSVAKTLRHSKESTKHYMKYNNRKWGVL